MEWVREDKIVNTNIKSAAGDSPAKVAAQIQNFAKSTQRTSSKCSFGHRNTMTFIEKEKHSKPGFHYNIPSTCTRFGINIGPSYSFGTKFPGTFDRYLRDRIDDQKPLPDQNEKIKFIKKKTKRGPVLLGRSWNTILPPNTNPGPGSYNIPSTFGQGPSIKYKQPSRNLEQDIQNRSKDEFPGPGHYDVTPVGVIKKVAPAYGLRGRFKQPKNTMDDIPAPNRYAISNCTITRMKSSPNFSFGMRHNPKTLGMLCPEDKAWSLHP